MSALLFPTVNDYHHHHILVFLLIILVFAFKNCFYNDTNLRFWKRAVAVRQELTDELNESADEVSYSHIEFLDYSLLSHCSRVGIVWWLH